MPNVVELGEIDVGLVAAVSLADGDGGLGEVAVAEGLGGAVDGGGVGGVVRVDVAVEFGVLADLVAAAAGDGAGIRSVPVAVGVGVAGGEAHGGAVGGELHRLDELAGAGD